MFLYTVLHSGDVDAEIEKQEKQDTARMDEKVDEPEMPPRPLSPTRLQPVVAPEAEMVTDVEELIRIRSEFPRALKRRGSIDVSQPLKELPLSQPNHYKQMINKLFRRRIRIKEGPVAESGSSSDEEESPKVASIPITEIQVSSEQKVRADIKYCLETVDSSYNKGDIWFWFLTALTASPIYLAED